MFQYEGTAIYKSEINIPEPGTTLSNELSGSCSATSAVGIPTTFSENRFILCKVNVKATLNGRDEPLLTVTSISRFAVTDDNFSEDEIVEKAERECGHIAMQKTADKIADVTELLCGQRIDLPIGDD